MKLLIDIPEHIYEHAKESSEDSRDEFDAMRAIANGIQQESRSEKPNKWIPVSERLPEENGRYLVYFNTKVFPIRILHFAKNLNEISLDFNCSFKSKKVGWYDYDSENGFFEWTGVEAWMPLPQLYKAESEDKE